MPSLAERAFVQEMMGQHAMKGKDALKLFNKCLEKAGEQREVREDDLGDELEGANTMLRRYDMQLTAVMYGGAVWWGLVNTSRDEVAQLSCVYSAAELALFQAIGREIRGTEEGYFPLVQAQLLAKGANMTVADCGRVIKRFADAMWLAIERKDGVSFVKFGPRSLLELPEARSWARDRSRGVSKDMEVQEAPVKRRGKGRRLEEEEEEEEEVVAPKRRGRKGRRVEEMDEVAEMEIEEQPRRSGRAKKNSEELSRRTGKRKKNVVVEDDEDEIVPQERPARRPRTRASQMEDEQASQPSQPRRRFTRSQMTDEEDQVQPKRRRTRRR